MKFSFGIQLEPQFGYTKSEVDQIADSLEQDPLWDMIWISDHMFLDENSTDKSSFDCWTLMTYLAVKYPKLRIAPLVLCNSYRHPSILAKMVATLDQLSEGRIEMGYGAGWKEIEYNAYGITFPPVGGPLRISTVIRSNMCMGWLRIPIPRPNPARGPCCWDSL